MKVIPHSRAIRYDIELTADEAVALYWAFDGIVCKLEAYPTVRDQFPELKPVFELYDALYHAGVTG